MPTVPIDIQAELDKWLEGNPDAQKYVAKLYYVPAGTAVPDDATHQLQLRSVSAGDRQITIAAVLYPQTALLVDMLLALLATQPGAARA